MSESVVVVGDEHDLAVAFVVGLDRRLVAGDTGDDDVAFSCGGLAVAHDVVPVEDADVDHRLAPDPQHEQFTVSGEVGGHGNDFLDVLGGENIGAGSHVADQGNVANGATFYVGSGVAFVADLDGAWLRRIADEVAGVLQVVEVRLDGGGRLEADGFADLAHRRWVTPLVLVLDDDIEDLALACGERVGHGASLCGGGLTARLVENPVDGFGDEFVDCLGTACGFLLDMA